MTTNPDDLVPELLKRFNTDYDRNAQAGRHVSKEHHAIEALTVLAGVASGQARGFSAMSTEDRAAHAEWMLYKLVSSIIAAKEFVGPTK